MDFTGSFMMFTLRLISIAMDYQDGINHKYFKKEKKKHGFSRMPTVLEFVGYLFGLGGTMVGPHFYYDEYLRYANEVGEYENLRDPEFPLGAGAALKALASSCFAGALYLQLGTIITDRPRILTMNDPGIGACAKIFIGFAANLEYSESSVPPFFFLERKKHTKSSHSLSSSLTGLKLYFAWHLEEAALIVSGFGYSGLSTKVSSSFPILLTEV